MKQSAPSMRDAIGLCEGRHSLEAVTIGPETFLDAAALLTTRLHGWN